MSKKVEKKNKWKMENFYKEVDILRLERHSISKKKKRMHWKGLTADWTARDMAHKMRKLVS